MVYMLDPGWFKGLISSCSMFCEHDFDGLGELFKRGRFRSLTFSDQKNRLSRANLPGVAEETGKWRFIAECQIGLSQFVIHPQADWWMDSGNARHLTGEDWIFGRFLDGLKANLGPTEERACTNIRSRSTPGQWWRSASWSSKPRIRAQHRSHSHSRHSLRLFNTI